jgi:SAM-dependent methyltransferase
VSSASRAPSRSEDAELRAGSAAHYEDPDYYDKTYRDRTDDVAYYVALSRRVRGRVLELGCGSGRITLPMARAGAHVTGVDLSEEMLAALSRSLADEPAAVRSRVRVRRGDMRSVRVEGPFALVVCPFNAFLHLYTRRDVERFLARVRGALSARGELVFDVSVPEPEELARDPNKPHYTPRFRYPGVGTVRYRERFDYDRMRQVLFVSMEFLPVDGSASWMTPLAHRQFFPQELEALLHYNGFRVSRLTGDFTERAPTNETRSLVVHAKLRRAGGR